jgi:hypothetical protein
MAMVRGKVWERKKKSAKVSLLLVLDPELL